MRFGRQGRFNFEQRRMQHLLCDVRQHKNAAIGRDTYGRRNNQRAEEGKAVCLAVPAALFLRFMNLRYLLSLSRRNFIFWLSRKIDYPLLPPDMVQVNFTFQCNLRCKMCGMYEQMNYLRRQGRQVEIDSDTFRKVTRETKELGINNFLFIGGEPFLRKDLFDLVSYAKSLGLNTIIVTNGVLLNEDNIKRCFDSGVDWLSISIDAASERVFSKIRGEDVLGRIINNIKILNSMRKGVKKEFPKTVAVCTIMDDNLEELLGVVHLCKTLEIERVLFQPVVANNIDQTQRNANSPGFVPPGRIRVLDKAINKLLQYKRESAQNFDFVGNSMKNLKLIKKYFRGKLKPKDSPCYAGYNRLQIVQEGKLYFCANQERYEANFGDIKKDSLRSLWYSGKAKSYRKLIRQCRFPCLQWCSYRDDFYELIGMIQKEILFGEEQAQGAI